MQKSELLGIGTYGCVYFGNPLNNNNDKKLVKLMLDPDDFYKEIKNIGMLKILNNTSSILPEQFLITNIPHEFNKLSNNDIQNIELCNMKGNKKIYQIVFSDKFKGIDLLQNIKLKHISLNLIYQYSISLYQSIFEYGIAGIIHNDIKPNNIVYIKKNNNLYFIDFGLLTTFNRFFTKKHKSFVDKTFYSSPEIDLFDILIRNKSLNDFITIVINRYKSLHNNNIFFKFYSEKNMIKDLSDMYYFYYKKINNNIPIYEIFTDDDKKKIDLFSLSVSLYTLYFLTNKPYNTEIFINTIIIPSICMNNQKRLSTEDIINRYYTIFN